MIYLILQIAFILGLAAVAGVGVGWWVRGRAAGGGGGARGVRELPDNPFDARFRLEQCHRDNSALRRELKEVEERAEKLQARFETAEQMDDDVMERLESAEIRVQALMEDLQMRDDTIEALERELEALRSNS
ncbi:MAG: hypothetical protein KJ914_03310 [Gammaproteobacteria bacterium]|nr:hypothetical protein [Gammaproteobacteria bacterium]MBU1725715.1 hypothetical protein [Gammaproteobacteria bacterium]MBU2003933.1 hypothetical protein [Gammaproteobacteria bacterium]